MKLFKNDLGDPMGVQLESRSQGSRKGAVGAKVDVPKSEQKGQKVRKALADISKAGNASVSNASKISSSKKKSAFFSSEDPKSIPKTDELSEQAQRKCNEWAKEGIEHVKFSGTDAYFLEKEIAEKRVKKKVDKVISALREWTRVSYGLDIPTKDVGKEFEDSMKLELEPEVLPPLKNASLSSSGNGDDEDPFFAEESETLPITDYMIELKLRGEYV
ncbi:hypothetical protein ACLOJK_017359 [Asimina triloba]